MAHTVGLFQRFLFEFTRNMTLSVAHLLGLDSVHLGLECMILWHRHELYGRATELPTSNCANSQRRASFLFHDNIGVPPRSALPPYCDAILSWRNLREIQFYHQYSQSILNLSIS